MSTLEGTYQGGIISPTLCNVALNGLEEVIKKANPLRKGISPGVHIIRYADDMIITGKNKEIIINNWEIIEILGKRGVKLNENKTLVTHVKKGFYFLGFIFRRNEWKAKLNKVTDQETVLIFKHKRKSIEKLMESIKKIITINKPIQKIIQEPNPIIRGWA